MNESQKNTSSSKGQQQKLLMCAAPLSFGLGAIIGWQHFVPVAQLVCNTIQAARLVMTR